MMVMPKIIVLEMLEGEEIMVKSGMEIEFMTEYVMQNLSDHLLKQLR